MKNALWTGVALMLGAVSGIAAAQTAVRVEKIADLPGKAPEGMIIGADGAIYVASASSQELLRCQANTCRQFASVPMRPINVVRREGGGFVVCGHVTVPGGPGGDTPPAPGADPFAALKGAGRLAALDARGQVSKIVNVGSLPNGLTPLGHDVYLAADSVDGVVWRVDMSKGEVTEWLAADELKRVPGKLGPGVNGAKRHNHTLYLAQTGSGALYRIGIGAKGESQGKLTKVADVKSADDFDVAKDGTAYVATHGAIVRVAPDGSTSDLTDAAQVPGGPSVMLSGDQKSLYVLTGGATPALLRVWLP